jgi:hypothetical protein
MFLLSHSKSVTFHYAPTMNSLHATHIQCSTPEHLCVLNKSRTKDNVREDSLYLQAGRNVPI